jgi:hypothetical protein
MNREMQKPAERKKLANERRLCCATQQKVLKYEAERSVPPPVTCNSAKTVTKSNLRDARITAVR